MSVLSWLLGYRKHKAHDNSIPKSSYKDKPYKISKHAVDQMQERKISKGEVHTNLHTKPLRKSKVIYDCYGRPSYNRISDNKITTAINPRTKNVVTVHRLHTKDYNKLKSKRR